MVLIGDVQTMAVVAVVQLITNITEALAQIYHPKRDIYMYRLSKFVRITKNSNRLVLYNYRTGGLYWEYIDSSRYNELTNIITGNINENSKLLSLLLSKGFLIHESDDEYSILQTQYSNYKAYEIDSTIRLTIFVNEMCNFKCVYCYEENNGGEIEYCTLEGVICFLDSLIDETTKCIVISWFGGEPLLSVSKIVEFMKNIQLKFNNLIIQSSITTNGFLLDSKVHSLLQSACVNEYQITVDSFEHDMFRKTRSGELSLNRIIENIRAILSSYKPSQIHLRINLNPVIYGRIYEFLDFVKTFANQYLTIHFHPIADMGGDIVPSLICDQDFFVNTLPDLNKYCQENNLNTAIMHDMLCPFSGTCYAGNSKSFVIDRLGLIRKCTVDYNGVENIVGYIKDSNAIRFSQESNDLWCENYSLKNPICKDCEKLPVCYGAGCPLKAIKGQFSCNKNATVEETIILQASYQYSLSGE